MKIKISKRKFYHKFDYKITLCIEGCSCLRYHTVQESKKFLSEGIFPKFYLSDQTKIKIVNNKEMLIQLCDVLTRYDDKRWKKRIEANVIDIYANDLDLIKEIENNLLLYPTILTLYKPLDNSICANTMIVKKLPDDKYNYRVYLLPHKLKNNLDEKQKYVSWLMSQNGKIKISEKVKCWFLNTEWNWDPRYILVDEESTLLMLKLRNSELVGRVYRFVTPTVDKY